MNDSTSSPGRVRFSSPFEIESTATAVPPVVRGVPCKCQEPWLLAQAADVGPEAMCQRCGGTVRMAWAASPLATGS